MRVFYDAFHPELRLAYPQSFNVMRRELYNFCLLVEPKEENYHKLFNRLSLAFDNLLATVAGKPEIVPWVVRSEHQADVEVERSRKKTKHNPHLMTLRSHGQDSEPPHLRFSRQY